jgi:hypothetical protein
MTRPSIDSALDIVFVMVKSLLHVHLQFVVVVLPFQHPDIGLGGGLNYPLIQSISAYGLVRPEDNLTPFILRTKKQGCYVPERQISSRQNGGRLVWGVGTLTLWQTHLPGSPSKVSAKAIPACLA